MRGRIKSYILCIVVIAYSAITSNIFGQVDAQFTQYWAIPNYYNPGATGTTDFIKIIGGSRMQWVGMTNAPSTFVVAADSPLKLLGKRVGVGVVLQQETLGLYTSMSGGLQFSYKINLFGGELSLGLQPGMLNQTFRGSEVELVASDDDDSQSTTDEGIPTTDIGGMAFDVAFGAFYTHKYFWVGISATHLTQPTISLSSESDTGDTLYEFEAGRAFYFMAGGNIPIKNTLFEVQPSMLIRSDLTTTQAEVTARLRYKKFLSGGFAYRYNDAVSILLGAEYKNVYIGYSYDYSTSAIAKVSSGSHEIFVAYNMKLDLSDKNKNKHKSIRIM
ncbi:MAG: PorP/SprF family type IX secretion system membrane protein [Bacteroidales bacterium]